MVKLMAKVIRAVARRVLLSWEDFAKFLILWFHFILQLQFISQSQPI